MKFYAIMIDKRELDEKYRYIKVGREYYTSSNAKCIGQGDVHYAQLFPNTRDLKTAMNTLRPLNPTAVEVEVSVTILRPVKL